MQEDRVEQGNDPAIHGPDYEDELQSIPAGHVKEIHDVLSSTSEGKKTELRKCFLKTYHGGQTSNLVYQCISNANTGVSSLLYGHTAAGRH